MRNDLDVCAKILEITQSGADVEIIFKKTRLNSIRGKRYIKRLIDIGYLQPTNKNHFMTTESGFIFLKRYKEVLNDSYNFGMLEVRE